MTKYKKNRNVGVDYRSYAYYILWAIVGAFVAIGYNKITNNSNKFQETEKEKEKVAVKYPIQNFDYYKENYQGFLDKEEIEALKIGPENRTEEHPRADIRHWPPMSSEGNYPPGHLGSGVEVLKMNEKTKARRKAMFQDHAFDEFVSELIPLDRELPDWRDQWCKDNYDQDIETLPPTSVIICFHNEAWSTLLRSVHSVVNRTPKILLKELILIDDKSNRDHLGSRLEEYLRVHFSDVVKLIRLDERHGLMRCRMRGIKEAQADVLTFLDSHIEASPGWVEPLLHRIKEDHTVVPNPVIDTIHETTMYYTFIQKQIYGLMNWRMFFEWHVVDEFTKKHPWAPHDNPIMAGGLFSIHKSWFEKLGYYDEGMTIWGGENFELSFKIWMCGGRIEVIPCSRVGHIFRSWSPYVVDPADVVKNNLRVAKVWMDEFQYIYYERLPEYDESKKDKFVEDIHVEERVQLRKELQCEDFKWFLDNVAKQLPYHDLIGKGEIRNHDGKLCLDQNDSLENRDLEVSLQYCHGQSGFQYWWMNRAGYLLRDYMCIGVLNDGLTVAVRHCNEAHPWSYDVKSQQLRYSRTQTCMTVGAVNNIYTLTMKKCDKGNEDQRWSFTSYHPNGIFY